MSEAIVKRQFELLTVRAIHQCLGAVVDAHLQHRRFVSIKPLQWLRSQDAPIRQLFEYRQLKGGALAPTWGYSFDFVPHFSGRDLKWHRTEKSALFDAFVDGQRHRDLVLTYIYGLPGLREDLEHRVAAAVQVAIGFWAEGDTPGHVYKIVEELRSRPSSEFFPQLRMASAFCLACSGRAPEGKVELERIIQAMNKHPSTRPNDSTVAKLWRAFESAGRH